MSLCPSTGPGRCVNPPTFIDRMGGKMGGVSRICVAENKLQCKTHPWSVEVSVFREEFLPAPLKSL